MRTFEATPIAPDAGYDDPRQLERFRREKRRHHRLVIDGRDDRRKSWAAAVKLFSDACERVRVRGAIAHGEYESARQWHKANTAYHVD